jgi:putative ABC transport system substrate-binding protein
MRRRAFVSGLGMAVACPLAAIAQRSDRDRLLKVCTPGRETHCRFSWGLEEAGYAGGRNLLIEYRYADGDYHRLPDLARDLVRRNIEVLMASGRPDTARAAMQATTEIPIVGTSVSPLVKHFNHPEGQCDRGQHRHRRSDP